MRSVSLLPRPVKDLVVLGKKCYDNLGAKSSSVRSINRKRKDLIHACIKLTGVAAAFFLRGRYFSDASLFLVGAFVSPSACMVGVGSVLLYQGIKVTVGAVVSCSLAALVEGGAMIIWGNLLLENYEKIDDPLGFTNLIKGKVTELNEYLRNLSGRNKNSSGDGSVFIQGRTQHYGRYDQSF